MLVIEVWEFCEREICRGAVEKFLHGELVLVRKSNSCRNEVVINCPSNFAPEEDFFSRDTLLKFEKGELELNSLLQIESEAINLEVLQFVAEILNVHFLILYICSNFSEKNI